MSATTLPSETLQTIVLHALAAGPITDTRELVLSLSLPGGAASASGSAPRVVGPEPEEQLALKGALDSLQLREVRPQLSCPVQPPSSPFPARPHSTRQERERGADERWV